MQNTFMSWIAGVDEAGCGPLAGPVIAAAVILNPDEPILGLKDSKKLTLRQRENLFEAIQKKALAWAFGRSEVDEIDSINIRQATLMAMQRAVQLLKVKPHMALVDGNATPLLSCEVRTIIRGDQLEPAISAASIVAKVLRDREMLEWDKAFPLYGFAKHKGYGTREHLLALKQHGPCEIHRRSYAPVAKALYK